MQLNSDDPIYDKKHDRFQRHPFAEGIAKNIINRNSTESIVIGINGAWGEGKTTVLNFIHNLLKVKYPKIVVVRFNPWRYNDEDALLKEFFDHLASQVKLAKGESKLVRWAKSGNSLKKPLEVLFTQLQKFGAFADAFYPIGNILTKLGETMSAIKLLKLKERLNELLIDSKLKLVVIIDDIDRLEDNEIHAIFRLVKLTADFANTTYVLAFDHGVVSKVINQRYGTNEGDPGFIEKIIQVPLDLPTAQRTDISDFCLDEIEKVLKSCEIEILGNDANEFLQLFYKGLLPWIDTPRMGIRYINSLIYSIPILKGEVNVVDLLIIEGIRIFHSDVYEFIKQNPEYFVERYRNSYDHSMAADSKVRLFKECFAEVITGYRSEEAEAITSLLQSLFPFLREVYNNASSPPQLAEQLIKNKNIGSYQYFHRYFALTVLKYQVSDKDFESFLKQVSLQNLEKSEKIWARLTAEINHLELFEKLRIKEDEFTWDQAKALSQILAKRSADIPEGPSGSFFRSAASQASWLIRQFLKNHQQQSDKFALGKKVVEISGSLKFAYQFMRLLYPGPTEKPFFSPGEMQSLYEVGLNRYLEQCNGKAIFLKYPNEAYSVLETWVVDIGKPADAEQYINALLLADPSSIVDFLKMTTPYSVSNQRTLYGNYREDSFNMTAKIFSPTRLFNLIKTNFPDLAEEKAIFRQHEVSGTQTNDNIVKQFCHWHRVRLRKNESPSVEQEL